MKLRYITISNYRSLGEVRVDVDLNCRIFLGINETGKTSILRALGALSDDFSYEYHYDAKCPVDTPYDFNDPLINYCFEFTLEEKKEILKTTFGEDYRNWPFGIGKYKLDSFCDALIKRHYYKVTLTEAEKDTSRLYVLNEKLINPKPGWFHVNEDIDVTFSDGNEIAYENSEWCEIKSTTVPEWDNVGDNFSKANLEDIVSVLSNASCSYMEDHLPRVVNWKYDKSLLLSDEIPIDEFMNEPNTCKPLRNIFYLAGVEDIKERITSDKTNATLFHNLLKKLSESATKHLKKVWKDYKDIKITLKESSGRFSVLVEDKKNLYNFKQRSDGFKRFISFSAFAFSRAPVR